MATDSDQQKELLLGNKQLLSIFFVGVVLLGIAFTIGYITGRNTTVARAGDTGKSARAEQSDTQTDRAQPPSQEARARPDDPTPSAEPAPDAAPVAAAPASRPKAAVRVESDPTAARPAARGSYLQVFALKREDAENNAKMLRSRGYQTLLGESSKEGLFRVLVGPFQNMSDLAESKQKLKASGMESFIVK